MAGGFFSRLFGRSTEQRMPNLNYGAQQLTYQTNPLTYGAPDGEVFNLIDGGNPFAGIYGNPNGGSATAARSATALACVSVISSSLASLPPRLYRVDPGAERVEVQTGPYAAILRRPNRHQQWDEMLQTLMAGVLMHGNGLLEVIADGNGMPTELRTVPWPGVAVSLLPSGDIVYDVPVIGGQARRLLGADVIHIRDLADGMGLVGTPRMARCPDVLRAALGAQTYALQVLDHGSTPSGILTLPADIAPDGFRRAEATFNGKHVGNRRVLFTDASSTFTPLNTTPENSQALESRRFSCEEVARVFGVPAIMVGINDHSTMTNSETSGRFFAQHCLAPWATRIERALTYALFGDEGAYDIELDMTSLQRGSDVERWQCWQIALQNGVLSPADVRTAESWSGAPPLAVKADPVLAKPET